MKHTIYPFPAFFITIAALLLFSGCSDSTTGNSDPEPEIEINQIADLDARGEDGHYTFFSLRTGEVVDAADSASVNWDLAFNGTTIRINSGESGPGEAGAIILDLPFQEVGVAPSEGYNIDTAEELAIPSGAGNGWYSYDFTAHVIAPIENKTIVVRTADGNHYSKVEIEHYYRGSPDITDEEFRDNPTGRESGYYTFRYAIQLEENVRELTNN